MKAAQRPTQASGNRRTTGRASPSGLDGRHLLVIGGTRGIGRAFTRLATDLGAKVSLVSRMGGTTAASTVRSYVADVTDATAVESVVSRAVAERGKLNGVVLFQRHRGVENAWAGNLAASLTATRDVIQASCGRFDDSQDASIVVLASSAARFVADEQNEGYHAAKTGLIGLMRYFAFKLGPKGIRVNAVSPGTLLKEESKKFFLENRKLHRMYQRITPLRRMGTAEEVAQVIAFVLSPAASFLTGQEILVDGGVSLHWHESMARAWLDKPLSEAD